MRTTLIFAALLAAAISLFPRAALANHNTVTVSTPIAVTRLDSSRRTMSGTVSVRNTTTNAQTGQVTLIVFTIDMTGAVTELSRQVFTDVNLPATNGGSVSFSFNAGVSKPGFYLILADYASSVNGNPVAHTHSRTALADAR